MIKPQADNRIAYKEWIGMWL